MISRLTAAAASVAVLAAGLVATASIATASITAPQLDSVTHRNAIDELVKPTLTTMHVIQLPTVVVVSKRLPS